MFKNNDAVKVTKNGLTLDGRISGERTVFYPDSTVNKYGSGTIGRAAVGYKVDMPIVLKDGTLYMSRGQVAMGLSYVEEKLITKA